MFTYPCPTCQMTLQAEEQWVGHQARCPRCQTVTAVPRPWVATLPDPPRPAPSPSGRIIRQPATIDDGRPKPPAPVVVPGYELLEELGRGGMGVVYKARHIALNRIVALKMILLREHASKVDQVRFRQEAIAVARLSHPNIVQVYEVGEHSHQPFMALEFCLGGTLAQMVANSLLPGREAAAIIEALARAAHSAHLQGIVHRDLKPANVLLAADGTPKISDFGLAKQLGQGHHTATGAILGTPAYMAPEQAEGKIKDIGPWTDVYSLGAILYELLTGRPPFSGPVRLVLINALATEPPAPRSLNPGCPRDLETICLKCLQKPPIKRYLSAEALADDLRRYLNNQPIYARPVSTAERIWWWARRNPAVASTASLTLVLLVVAAFVSVLVAIRFDRLARQATQKAEDERLASEKALAEQRKAEQAQRDSQLQQVRLTAGAGWARHEQDPAAALPWFVESLRLARAHPEQERLAQMRLNTLLGQYPPFRLWFGARAAAFDTTGERLVTAGHDGVARVWNAITGEPVTGPLTHPAPVLTAAFSHDGKRLVTGCADSKVRVWEMEPNREPRTITCRKPVWYVRFTRDDKSLILGWDQSTFATCNPDFRPKDEPRGEVLGNILGFSDDGQLAVRAGTVQQVGLAAVALAPLDAGKVEVWELAQGRARHAAVSLTAVASAAALSTDNKLLATAHVARTNPVGFEVRVWDLAGGKAVFTKLHDGQPTSLAVSRGRVACGSADGGVMLWNLADEKTPLATLSQQGPVTGLTFSPDGKRLALLWNGLDSADTAQVRILDATAGVSLCPPLKHARDEATRLRFSADGARLLVSGALGPGEVCVWDVSAVAPHARALPESRAVSEPLFGPDGQTVYGFPDGDKVRHTWSVADGKLLDKGTPGGKVTTRPIVTVRLTPVEQEQRVLTLDERGRPVEKVRRVTVFTARQEERERTGDKATLDAWKGQKRPLLTLPGRQLIVDFSDDSQLVLASERGSGIGEEVAGRVWDTATRTPRSPPLKHGGPISAAAFSPNKTVLATLESGRVLRLWDVASGDPLTAPLLAPVSLSAVRLGSDLRWLVSVRAEGEADRLWLWDLLAASDRSVEVAALQAQLLSRRRLDPTRSLESLDGRKLQTAWEMFQWHSPPEESKRRDWHAHRAEVCLAAGIWEPAQLHLSRLIELAPEGKLYAQRAQAQASLGQYEQALGDLSRSVELGHVPAEVLYQQAVAHLALGQEEGYTTACVRLLKEHAAGKDEEAQLAAWTAVLRPRAAKDPKDPKDPNELVALGEKLVKQTPQNQSRQRLLGAIYYRVGRYQEAVDQLEKARAAERSDLLHPEIRVLASLFLAMAQYRLDDKQKAAETVSTSGAHQLIEGGLSWADLSPPPPWTTAVEAMRLLSEAEILIGLRTEPARETPKDPTLPAPKGPT